MAINRKKFKDHKKISKGLHLKRTSLSPKLRKEWLEDEPETRPTSRRRPSKSEVQAAARVIAPFIYLRSTITGSKDVISKTKKSFRSIKLTRPSFSIQTISSHLKHSYDLPMFLLDTASTLKNCTSSRNMVLYLKDDSSNELYQFSVHVSSTNHKINFKIEPGNSMAAYVAYAKEYIVTEDCLGDPRFPLGTGWRESCAKAALCVPLVTPGDLELFAVIELTKDFNDAPYTKADVEACLNVCGWISATVQENQESMLIEKEKSLYSYLRQLMSIYFCQPIELNMFFSELVVSARIALCAQSSAFYTLANVDDSGEVEMDMYVESGSDKHRRKQWFSLKKSKTVAANVARTGKMLNLDRRELKSLDFNLSIYKPIPCHSILSVPIQYNDRIIGVVELLNKYDSMKFSDTDERIMKNIVTFCDVTLSCYILKEDMKRLLSRLMVRKKMLEFHMQPCEHDLRVFHDLELRIPREINSLYYHPDNSVTNMDLCYKARHIIRSVLSEAYLNVVDVNKLLLMTEKATPSHSFHNFKHSFSAFHTIAFIIAQYPEYFSPDEKEEMLLTALCHGVHRKMMIKGTGDVDLIPDHSEWKAFKPNETLLYLEVIFNVCNVLHPKEDKKKEKMESVAKILVSCYRKTNLVDGKEFVERLLTSMFKWNNPLDRVRMKKAMMLVSMYNIHFKSFTVSMVELMKLYGQLRDEILQILDKNDQELKKDIIKELPFHPVDNGRSLNAIAAEQVQFLDRSVLPWIYLINVLFPKTIIMYQMCEEVKECWKDLMHIKKDETWFPDVSTVFKSPEDRQDVLEILSTLEDTVVVSASRDLCSESN